MHNLLAVVLLAVTGATHRCSGALLLPVAPAPAAASFYTLRPVHQQYNQHQYHSQDSLGQYSYGYSGALSSKAETKTLDGVTRGSYSYIDANNELQTVAYTADTLNGFRAMATNLPKAPAAESALSAGNLPQLARLAPLPVLETAEVAAARAEHMAAYEAVLRRDEQLQQQQQQDKRTEGGNDVVVQSASSDGDDGEQPRIVTPQADNGFLEPNAFVYSPAAPASSGSFSYAYNMPAAGYYYGAYPTTFYTPAAAVPALRPAALQYAYSAAALPHPPAPKFAFEKFHAPALQAPAPLAADEQQATKSAAENKPQFFRGAVEQRPAIVVTDTVAVRAERFSEAQHKAARAAFDAHKAKVDATIAAEKEAANRQSEEE